MAAPFVLTLPPSPVVVGYYTLSRAFSDQVESGCRTKRALDSKSGALFDRRTGFHFGAKRSSASIHAAELPAALAKRLPRYPVLPATLLGRLAVDQEHRGLGFGTWLLLDALRRALRSEVASLAVLVDAKDEAAAVFYARHDFRPLPDQPRRLFLPIVEIAALFSEG